jgi:hypothetical protein
MQALENRLQQAEARPEATGTTSDNAFNPAISAILTGTYSNLSQDPSTYRRQGFLPAGDETGPGSRSFSLGESELTFSANADHLFKGISVSGDVCGIGGSWRLTACSTSTDMASTSSTSNAEPNR